MFIYLNSQITDCESLIDDPEMGEEARVEIETLQKEIQDKKQKLTVSMLPPDPETGKKIQLWKYVPEQVEMRHRFLPEICLECIRDMLKQKGGE